MRARQCAARRFGRYADISTYLLIATVLAGCERDTNTPAERVAPAHDAIIAFIGPPADQADSAPLVAGAKLYATNVPTPAIRVFTPTDGQPESVLKVVDQVMAIPAAGVVFAIPDSGVTNDIVARFSKLTGPLVTIGPDVPDLHNVGRVDFDWPDAAEKLAKQLTPLANGKRSYILLHQRGKDARETRIYDRFNETTRSGDLKRLEEREWKTPLAPRDSCRLLYDMITEFPNVGLIVTLTPAPWLLEEPPCRLRSESPYVTLGAAPRLWSKLKAGEALALVGGVDPTLASDALRICLDLTNGARGGVLRLLPCEIVTREMLDDFSRRYADAAGMDVEALTAAAR